MTTKLYTVLARCEIAGVWHEAESKVPLTPEQAQYLAPPFGSVVAPARERVRKAPAKGRRRGRLDRN